MKETSLTNSKLKQNSPERAAELFLCSPESKTSKTLRTRKKNGRQKYKWLGHRGGGSRPSWIDAMMSLSLDRLELNAGALFLKTASQRAKVITHLIREVQEDKTGRDHKQLHSQVVVGEMIMMNRFCTVVVCFLHLRESQFRFQNEEGFELAGSLAPAAARPLASALVAYRVAPVQFH